MKKVVITHAFRTPIGSFNGALSTLSAAQLGSIVIQKIVSESGIDPMMIDEVIMGNVLTGGAGQAPARQAALFAGLPDKTECLTINKMCGSGLKAVMLAAQAISAGDADVVIAGGQESMSTAPYVIPQGRNGYRYGHGQILDTVLLDGLWDVYTNQHMGSCAEVCATNFSLTREAVDAFAVASYQRALAAQQEGRFNDEIVPVVLKSKTGDTVVSMDEEPAKVKYDKIPTLRPAFQKDGVITAANASKLNDGAAALLVMSEEKAKELGFTPLAEIVSQASAAKQPVDFTIAPAESISKALTKASLNTDDIDLYEINEAFAVVSLANNSLLKLDPAKVNVNGGAVALGHPIGASGARVLVTLLHEMKRRSSTYGVASLCIGGGEASALVVKR